MHVAAATAKSHQLCLTLCDPIDGSPPGSSISGILQARTLEWLAISFSNAWKWKVKVKSLSRVRLLATPWTTAYQAPPSMGFFRQEYWSGVPLPSPDADVQCFENHCYIVSCYSSGCCSIAQSCLILCNPMNCSMPGFPVLHHLPELVQTHVHWVSDAIQPSRPLSSSSPPAFNFSKHRGLLKWVSSSHQFSSVQSLSHVQLFAIPWTAACQASLSFTISWSLLKLMSIESVMLSNHFILCHPLLLLPSIFPSIRIFSNESASCIRWPKY